MRARLVPIQNLSRVVRESWVDRSRRPYVRDGRAYVPVKREYSAECEIPERKVYTGRRYQMIGDVAVVHGRMPSDAEVAEIVRWKKPRGVLHIEGYSGPKRIPIARILHGEAGIVRHREHGYVFWLDPALTMFSKGNREEKIRIATIIRHSGYPERVADMFAGIGYFTIPAASGGARVHAMELNPVAYGFLRKNIIANSVGSRVTADCGDCRDCVCGVYDRIIMGHFDSLSLLPDALAHSRCGTVIHLHSTEPVSDAIRMHVEAAGFSAEIRERRVKKYAPGTWHIVQDVMLA